MPAFNDPVHDNQAREIFEKVFPDREIIQLDAQEIVMGGWDTLYHPTTTQGFSY